MKLEPIESLVVAVWQPEAALSTLAPRVRDLHESLGLLDRVRASTTDLATAERQIIERVVGWCTFPATLCGSVLDVDRRFLDRWMPGLARLFGYRTVDVATLRQLARLWYPDAPAFPREPGADELRQSIAEASFYRRGMFGGSR